MTEGEHSMQWAQRLALALLLVMTAGSVAFAQDFPWVLFDDTTSSARAGIVNAENAQLVVLRSSGALVIVSGPDTTLAGSAVDEQGAVTINGEQKGFISFAGDVSGVRGLWWLSLTGRVIGIDGLTGEVTESDSVPADLERPDVDPCPLWDEELPDCNIPTEIITHPQGASVCAGADVTLVVEAQGSSIVGYEWFKNGELIRDENSNRLFLESIGLFDTATYQVIVVDADGSRVASEFATLVVQECGQQEQPGLGICGPEFGSLLGLGAILAGMGFARRRGR
jgi:hypothetical protein